MTFLTRASSRPSIDPCACGGKPEVRMVRYAEDAMETWVECPACGIQGEEVEDAYSDAPTAILCWNAGGREKRR